MYTIFHKEYRQQRALFAVMLLFCFLIQFGYMLMKFFNGITIDFNTAALFSAALYAGAAATVAFAGECEDKTFDFLRRLPLTAETVMYGKTAWIILSTAVMLICSAALAVFWQLTDGGTANLGTRELWGILGTGIIETLVWGLFWSSRCRNPYYAVMLTYGCASVSFIPVLLRAAFFAAVLQQTELNRTAESSQQTAETKTDEKESPKPAEIKDEPKDTAKEQPAIKAETEAQP
ncbi:hypothetical protein FACS18942_07490 [Planctomycetales bacterium]|nr:hypothetical protein FACS18942_07490 [Planctomycetales bacterium]